MPESTDRYTATRLSAELGLDNRKMRDILTRVNPVQVKGRSKLYLLRDVVPHAAKYLGAPDVIDLNVERARKMKAEAELAEIELAKEREDLIQVEAVRQVWGELVIAAKSRLLSISKALPNGRCFSTRTILPRHRAIRRPAVRPAQSTAFSTTSFSKSIRYQASAWSVPSPGSFALRRICPAARLQAMPSRLTAPPIPFALFSPKGRA
ncbi:MAG: hypothetical protein QGG84_08060 [Rhodospirillales bacterium]|nr:hypothetical protein [Rhodospirillales bacterium]